MAQHIAELMEKNRFFIMNGEMGSGKTTLVTQLSKVLGIRDEISSPTYSIVNEYLLPNGKKFFHFDLYRIKDKEELFDIGIEEYFYSDNYCFVEWPQIAEDILPEHVTEISITGEGTKRLIEIGTKPAS